MARGATRPVHPRPAKRDATASGVVTYDWVTFDGTTKAFVGASGGSAESLGWTALLSFQLDGPSASGSITAYIDEMTVYGW